VQDQRQLLQKPPRATKIVGASIRDILEVVLFC
jgi:hypothetical protein